MQGRSDYRGADSIIVDSERGWVEVRDSTVFDMPEVVETTESAEILLALNHKV